MKLFSAICPWLTESFRFLQAARETGRLGHGWLITGPAGIGKRNLAYLLAEHLLDKASAGAMPESGSPEQIAAGYLALAEATDLHPDLYRVRPEEGKRSISIEQIRQVTQALALKPHAAGCKVVVIEAADDMTVEAANALLKSLEEPTPDTYLLLVANRPGRLPATIRSRCQHLPLRRPDPESVRDWLEASGDGPGEVPPVWIRRTPLVAAEAMTQPEDSNKYNKISNNIKALYEGRADPFPLADDWQKDDPALALGCLIDSLRSRIRRRLVPDRWAPITESDAKCGDHAAVSTSSLFRNLEIAENLLDQLGRGINVELALKSLLLGLDPSQGSRVKP